MNEWLVAEYLKANQHKCFQVHAGNLFVCIFVFLCCQSFIFVFLCFLFALLDSSLFSTETFVPVSLSSFQQVVKGTHTLPFQTWPFIFIFIFIFVFCILYFVFLYFFVFFLLSRLADQVDWLWSVCGSAIARYDHSQ